MSSPSPRKRRRSFLKAALQIAKVYDAFHRFLAWSTGRLGRPMAAEIYFAIRHQNAVSVKGRVLLARQWRCPNVNDPALVNFFQMLKRWATPERPYSLVRVSAGGMAIEKQADREGYFEIDIPLDQVHSEELLIELPGSHQSEAADWPIRPFCPEARCLIISDIDDTVLISHAAQTLRMVATTLFGNALTRQLFPGTSELYQALTHGPDAKGDQCNPLAYVTSSPYNLHGLLYLIFKENELPTGSYFMTDWGLSDDRWLKRSHRDHKLDAITTVLSWFPDLPVILIGDSGQHDTAIYIEAALSRPGVVKEILIRNVSASRRIEALGFEVEKLRDSGTHFSFFTDSQEAAANLAASGWISSYQYEKVLAAME